MKNIYIYLLCVYVEHYLRLHSADVFKTGIIWYNIVFYCPANTLKYILWIWSFNILALNCNYLVLIEVVVVVVVVTHE